MSWKPDLNAVGRDTMLYKWDEVTYLFPPVPMIPKVLNKVQEEGITAIMVYVAQLAVVPSGQELPPSSSIPTAPLQGDINPKGGGTESLPGAPRGSNDFRQSLTVSWSSHDLTPDELDFLANHISTGSATGYNYAWGRFTSFCSEKAIDPFTCPANIIVKYLKKIYDDGAKYRTVNYVRSAISKLHIGFGDLPAGQHALVKKAVQAVFRLRPPLPKYKTTFDIGKVLTYVQQILGNNELLPIKLLSCKCLFLLSFYSISRMNSMSKLGSALEESQEHVVVPLLSLEKQARGNTIVCL